MPESKESGREAVPQLSERDLEHQIQGQILRVKEWLEGKNRSQWNDYIVSRLQLGWVG